MCRNGSYAMILGGEMVKSVLWPGGLPVVKKIAKCNYCGYMQLNPPIGRRKCPEPACGHKLVVTKVMTSKKKR